MGGNIPIASTQRAGEGDAFLLDNKGARDNIHILNQAKQASIKNNAIAKVAKDKQIADNAKNWYGKLDFNQTEIRPIDHIEASDRINNLFKDIKEYSDKGINPFDMASNPSAFLDMTQKMQELKEFFTASRSLNHKLKDFQTGIVRSQKDETIDFGKSMEKYKSIYNMPLADAVQQDLSLVQTPVNLERIWDKEFTDNLKGQLAPYSKVFNTKQTADDAQTAISGILQKQVDPLIGSAATYIEQGRVTPDDVAKRAATWLSQFNPVSLYDDNKTLDRSERARQFNTKEARMNRQFEYTKTKDAKAQGNPSEFNIKEGLQLANNGSASAQQIFIDSYTKGGTNNNQLIWVKGSDAIKGKKFKNFDKEYEITPTPYTVTRKGNKLPVNKDDYYIYYVDEQTGEKHLEKANNNSAEYLSNGLIGKSAESVISKSKTSGLDPNKDKTINDIPVGKKVTNSSSSSSSSGKSNSNNGSSSKGKFKTNIDLNK